MIEVHTVNVTIVCSREVLVQLALATKGSRPLSNSELLVVRSFVVE